MYALTVELAVLSVHRLATAETIPSFELLLQKLYIDYDENLPGRIRFFSTLS